MTLVVLALNLYFAAVLSVSGLAKLDQLDAFESLLQRYRLLPAWVIAGTARIFPWVEIALAVAVVTEMARLATATLVAVLFTVFLVIKIVLLRMHDGADCGCFGAAQQQSVDGVSIATATLLALFAWFDAWSTAHIPALSWRERLPIILLFGCIGSWVAWRGMLRRRFRHSIMQRPIARGPFRRIHS